MKIVYISEKFSTPNHYELGYGATIGLRQYIVKDDVYLTLSLGYDELQSYFKPLYNGERIKVIQRF